MQSVPYNSEREPVVLREYGRVVQDLLHRLQSEADKETRTRWAHILVALMRQLHPTPGKDRQEQEQKMWDHLHLLAGGQMDVESPYPVPDAEALQRKPKPVPYPEAPPKFRHYGRGVQKIVSVASEMTDPEEQEGAIVYVGKLMKRFYGQETGRESQADNTTIAKQIEDLSGGKLKVDIEKVNEHNLFDSRIKNLSGPAQEQRPQRGGGGGNNRNRRRGRSGGGGGNQNRRRR